MLSSITKTLGPAVRGAAALCAAVSRDSSMLLTASMRSICHSMLIVCGRSMRHRNLGNNTAFPVNNLVKSRQALLGRCGGVTDLSLLKIDPGLFSFWTGKLEHRSGFADALELNDVGNMEVA